MDERARKLLEAHVAHELSRLQGEPLRALVDARVADIFQWLEELRFADAVRVDDVVSVARRYALELRVSGGISELAGEIARVVLNSRANAEITVGDVVSSESFEDFSEKAANLDEVRGEILALIARSEALGAVTARVIAHVLTDLLRRTGRRAALGPAASLVDRLERELLPAFERRASELLSRAFADNHAVFASHLERHLRDVLDGDSLHELAEELWLHVSRMNLSDAFAFLGEQDLEDFVVLCFEFWLRFRKTTYMRRILTETIGHFFDKYADESVAGVIADMGVTPDMVANELKLLLVPFVEQACESGFLEQQLRRHLEDFYASEAYRGAFD